MQRDHFKSVFTMAGQTVYILVFLYNPLRRKCCSALFSLKQNKFGWLFYWRHLLNQLYLCLSVSICINQNLKERNDSYFETVNWQICGKYGWLSLMLLINQTRVKVFLKASTEKNMNVRHFQLHLKLFDSYSHTLIRSP